MFRNDDQRRAAFAHMRPGLFPRARTFFANRNPYAQDENASAGKMKRGGGKAFHVVPAYLGQRQREGSALLQKAGFTTGLGPRGPELRKDIIRQKKSETRRALKQLGLAAAGTALIAAPTAYLALRTGVGQRFAGKAIRRFRPLGAARSFTDFMGGKAAGGAENVVFRQAGNLQRWTNSKIDRGTSWLTGVSDIPAELLKREGAIKSQLLYATGKNKDHLLQELMRNRRSQSEVWTGRGAIDRADDWVKNKAGRVARRFGLPTTGSMQQKYGIGVEYDPKGMTARSTHSAITLKTGEGNWNAMLQRHHDVARLWGQVRKKGSGSLDGVEMARLKSGAIRRRGGSLAVPTLNKPLPSPTVSRPPIKPMTPSAMMHRADKNMAAMQSQWQRLHLMAMDELQAFSRHPAHTSREQARIAKRFQELRP